MEPTQSVPLNSKEGCPGVNSENAGKSKECEGCPYQQLCQQGLLKIDPDLGKIKEKLSKIKHKILVLSGKGGVGKSTVAAQLALVLSKLNFKVGLLDIDICGPSIPRMLALENQEVHEDRQGWSPVFYNEENVGIIEVMSVGFLIDNKNDAIIWRGPKKTGLIKEFLLKVDWSDLDYLIVDTPPGTSDEHISIIQLLQPDKSDGAIIVTTPQEVSLSDVRKEINFCLKTQIKIIGVVENMTVFVCPHCKKETQIFVPNTGGAEQMCKDFNLKLLGKIPIEPEILLCAEKGRCIVNTLPESVSSRAYLEIAKDLIEEKW